MRVAEHRAEPIGNARRAIGLALIESEARFVASRVVSVGEHRLSVGRVFIAPGVRDAPLNTL